MDDKSIVDGSGLAFFALGTVVGFSFGFCYWKMQKCKTQTLLPDDNTIKDSNSNDFYRMIIGVRSDLKMGKGKVAAQVAHAAVAAYVKANQKAPIALKRWIRHGQAKITVKLENESEMLALVKEAKDAGILVSIIHDAGHTQVEPNTRTVAAFGPATKDELDQITGHLKLY